jgi:VWFA-related protein
LTCAGIGQAAPQEDFVIRTTTSLVEVRVVAEDAHGKPVADLKKADFTISDDRQPRGITLFSAYRGLGAPSNGASGGQSVEASPTPSEYAVIVLDWLNTVYGNRVFVRDQVLSLLKSYKPRQRVAVFVLSRNNPRLLYDFTYDRDALTYMVENLSLDFDDQLGPAPPPGAPVGRGGRGDTHREDAIFQARNQLVETATTFEKIGDRLLHVPGRKTLLWVSTGIPMTVEGAYYGPFLESAFGKLNRSDTAVYSVFAPGLSLSPNNPLLESLVEFSHRTGGVAYYDNNDLTREMRQALEDTEVSYTLGFHMPENAKAGLHEIQVRVARPGVRLRYRESYDPAASIH